MISNFHKLSISFAETKWDKKSPEWNLCLLNQIIISKYSLNVVLQKNHFVGTIKWELKMSHHLACILEYDFFFISFKLTTESYYCLCVTSSSICLCMCVCIHIHKQMHVLQVKCLFYSSVTWHYFFGKQIVELDASTMSILCIQYFNLGLEVRK